MVRVLDCEYPFESHALTVMYFLPVEKEIDVSMRLPDFKYTLEVPE
jgi:hypothetical protein